MGDWWIDDAPYPGPHYEPSWVERFVEGITEVAERFGRSTSDLVNQLNRTPFYEYGNTIDSAEELDKILKKYSPIAIFNVDGSGLYYHDWTTNELKWLAPEAVRRQTRQVRDLEEFITSTLPVAKSLEKIRTDKQKRDIGAGRVQGHGPRSNRTFGRGGRKQY